MNLFQIKYINGIMFIKIDRKYVKVMQTETFGKKQYFTLLGLSAIFILLLPLAYYLIELKFTYPTFTYYPALFYINRVTNFFSVTCGAVLIYAYIRYSFKACLPFIAMQILILILFDIISLRLYIVTKEYTPALLLYITLNLTLTVAIIFFNFGITKLFTRHINNEILAVSLIILIMNLLRPINFTLSGFTRNLLTLILDYIFMFAAYLILLAVYDKHEKAHAYFSNAKTVFKKLWNKTAN